MANEDVTQGSLAPLEVEAMLRDNPHPDRMPTMMQVGDWPRNTDGTQVAQVNEDTDVSIPFMRILVTAKFARDNAHLLAQMHVAFDAEAHRVVAARG